MAATSPTTTRRDLETRLVEKAWKDQAFRKELLQDPKGMLERHTGQKLPAQVKIYVHEEDAHTLHFSIPPAPSNLTELADDDLAKVAGGTDIGLTIIGTILSGLSVAGITVGEAKGW